MKDLFSKRRLQFLEQCVGYLRYVLNDHFVLVLLVFLGFLSLQYRQLLLDFPKNPFWVILCLVLASLVLLWAGNVATYLEEPDRHFLLVKEEEVRLEIAIAHTRAVYFWSAIQLAGQLLLWPIYRLLGIDLLVYIAGLGLLTLLKVVLLRRRMPVPDQTEVLDWSLWLQREARRKQGILQFFALFTRVKGLYSSTKRRAYLDGLLRLLPRRQAYTWDYLYARALLRSGDFWQLSLRLWGLGFLVLFLVEQDWLAVGLAALFHYLLLFQLLALHGVYRYQYLLDLYPLPQGQKEQSLVRVLRVLVAVGTVAQLPIALFGLTDKRLVLVLVLVNGLLALIYLPYKAKKLID